MHEARQALEQRKAAGLDGGMQFTYRNPARSTDPGRALPGAAALVVGAWAYGRTAPGPSDRGGGTEEARPRGQVARYAWRDYYADLRAALGQLAGLLVEAGWVARVVVDDNALVDRAAATRAGLGMVWQKLQCPSARAGFVVRPGRRGHGRATGPGTPVADGCGPCRRCLGGLPDRCSRGAGGAGRPPLPGLALAGTGGVPFRVPGGLGRPYLRLRRLPGGMPSQPGGVTYGRGARAPPLGTRPVWTSWRCWSPPTTS